MSDLSLSTKLPARWTKLRPHPAGEAYTNSTHRFNVITAGRRSGKTERLKRKVVRAAFEAVTDWAPRFFLGAPVRHQAKDIFWSDIKALVGRDMMLKAPSESDLVVYVLNGAEIHVVGLDKPERIEGSPWDGGGVTEIANTKPTAWPQNIRPALADRGGWCDLEGVPEGRNHLWKLDRTARALMQEQGSKSEWGAFGWPSSDVLSAEEIEAARRDLDELTFQQEFEASFVNFEGRAYYPFTTATHTAPLKYNPKAPLIVCFDFNVAPGVCAVIQEQPLPGQFEHDAKTGAPLVDRPIVGTGVIAEVHIPRNSNTPAVCRRLVKDFGKHAGVVKCYGDATGGASGSAKVQGSDWELIKAELKPVFAERLYFYVKPSNPAERSRINAVNTRLRTANRDIRLMVDPVRAPNVVIDFEGVTLLEGGSGELDKAETPELTHLTDAIGYYLEHDFPVTGAGATKVSIGGH